MKRKRGRTTSYVLVDDSGCYVTDCGPLGPWAGDPMEMRFPSLKEARQARWEIGGENSMEIIKETAEAVG
jgi:hypothetical protein